MSGLVKFGDVVINPYASKDNPVRVGFVLRVIKSGVWMADASGAMSVYGGPVEALEVIHSFGPDIREMLRINFTGAP